MPDLIDFAGTHIPQIAGVLIMAAIGAYLAEFNSRRSRLAVAAGKFRNTIFVQLKGIYPVTQYWDMTIFQRLHGSITEIESAAEEFRFFIPFYRRWCYNKALQKYCEYCNKINWVDVAANKLYSDKTSKDHSEEFKNIVEHLLSFANKK